MTADVTWVLTDGKAGTRNGALGLAEAVGLPVIDKHVQSRRPWSWLPPMLWPPGMLGVGVGGDELAPPWPRLLISAGERSVGPALAIKRLSGGATFCVHILHPRVNPAKFDLVIVSAHDRLTGPNVRTTLGALHHVTREKLESEARKFEARYAHLPRPLVAVLIGGANRVYRFDRGTAEQLVDGLARICQETGGGLLITASRRTGAENEALLRERLRGLPAEVWNGEGDNPYFAFLGLADAIVVTGDSVNMASEACYTGKPVHVFRLPGGGGTKFDRFHESLVEAGVARPFDGKLENWQYDPLDERTVLAAEIRGKLDGAESLQT